MSYNRTSPTDTPVCQSLPAYHLFCIRASIPAFVEHSFYELHYRSCYFVIAAFSMQTGQSYETQNASFRYLIVLGNGKHIKPDVWSRNNIVVQCCPFPLTLELTVFHKGSIRLMQQYYMVFKRRSVHQYHFAGHHYVYGLFRFWCWCCVTLCVCVCVVVCVCVLRVFVLCVCVRMCCGRVCVCVCVGCGLCVLLLCEHKFVAAHSRFLVHLWNDGRPMMVCHNCVHSK